MQTEQIQANPKPARIGYFSDGTLQIETANGTVILGKADAETLYFMLQKFVQVAQ